MGWGEDLAICQQVTFGWKVPWWRVVCMMAGRGGDPPSLGGTPADDMQQCVLRDTGERDTDRERAGETERLRGDLPFHTMLTPDYPPSQQNTTHF